jgi:hypothetical protein
MVLAAVKSQCREYHLRSGLVISYHHSWVLLIVKLQNAMFSLYSQKAKKDWKLIEVPFMRTLVPFQGPHCHDLITSWSPHQLFPSYGVKISTFQLGLEIISQSTESSTQGIATLCILHSERRLSAPFESIVSHKQWFFKDQCQGQPELLVVTAGG